jgi:hypothetical protein
LNRRIHFGRAWRSDAVAGCRARWIRIPLADWNQDEIINNLCDPTARNALNRDLSITPNIRNGVVMNILNLSQARCSEYALRSTLIQAVSTAHTWKQ